MSVHMGWTIHPGALFVNTKEISSSSLRMTSTISQRDMMDIVENVIYLFTSVNVVPIYQTVELSTQVAFKT